MSSFSGTTPMLKLAVRNYFERSTFPEKGVVLGTVDTGFDGFLAIPTEAFEALGLGRLAVARRGFMADGSTIELSSALGSVSLLAVGRIYDGLVDTWPGVGEVLIGTRLLRRLRTTLDYCSGTLKVEACD